MPANFWFEERDTEVYYSFAKKPKKGIRVKADRYAKARTGATKTISANGFNEFIGGDYTSFYWETNWDRKIYHTREEYEASKLDDYEGETIYRKGTITPLQQVDELICEFMCIDAPSPDRDSHFFNAMHEIGFWKLYGMGGSWIEERHVEVMQQNVLWFMGEKPWNFVGPLDLRSEYKARHDRYVSEGVMARRSMLIEWVFLKKWRFHATG